MKRFFVYVHDFVPEVGHSNAMIETLANLPQNEVQSLTVVCFNGSNLEKLFPQFRGKLNLITFPGNGLNPFILKMIWFHFLSAFHTVFFTKKSDYKISIGMANLMANIINVQFLHYQWKDTYFKIQKFGTVKLIYKKFLYWLFELQEKFVYSQKNILCFCLSNFIQEDLIKKFNRNSKNTVMAYSGINLDKYKPTELDRIETHTALVSRYPAIKKIDPKKPIMLFVGAFERKGLMVILEKIKTQPDCQLVAIGKSEIGTKLIFPENVAWIEHTKELPLFYSLADQFLFPTYYEPFGLVILEAAMMGLDVHITSYQVGAAETLKNLPGIFLYESPNDFTIPSPLILDRQTKLERREERIKILSHLNWKNTAAILIKSCKEFIDR